MNILFADAYFYPELTALTHLERDLIMELAARGHKVDVICPEPSREVFAGDGLKRKRAKNKTTSGDDGARASRRDASRSDGEKKTPETVYGAAVHRFWAPKEKKSSLSRAIRYLWCNIREYLIGRRMKDTDLVFASSTPPTQGLVAGLIARSIKCPFIYSLQDVFPDSLVSTGLTKKGSVTWKIGRAVEDKTYSLSERVITISRSMERNIARKGVAREKTAVISNWVDPDLVFPIPPEKNRLFDEFDIPRDKFIVLYAGNFGAAQGAEIVIEAAKLLEDVEEILFVIFGGGFGFGAVKDYLREKKPANVIAHGLLPDERVAEVYSVADAALVTCKRGSADNCMPSKIWPIMACDTPIIASFDETSELSDILKAAHAGVCVPPEDAPALAGEIKMAYEKSRIFSTEGETHARETYSPAKDDAPRLSRPREYVLRFASRKECVGGYIKCMEEAARRTSDRQMKQNGDF